MKKESRVLHCKSCDIAFDQHYHPKARWAVAGAGAILGSVATESFLGGLLVGGLGYGAATAADVYIFSRRCPECGARGEITEAEVEHAPAEAAPGNGHDVEMPEGQPAAAPT